MASSKVMASTSQPNPDLPRQSSILSLTVADLQTDQSKNFGSMNMDDLLKNMYNDPEAFSDNAVAGDGGFAAADGGGTGGEVSLSRQGSFTLPKSVGTKTVDEVWKEIVHGNGEGDREPEMTLEDFLTKAGAVREEDVRIPVIPTPTGFGVDSMMNAAQFQVPPHMQSSRNGPGGFGVDPVGFGNGIDGRMVAVVSTGGGGGGGGRGKRRAVEEPPVDKATQQKQRRMIKNRESAARSRERKQAYTVELESLVTQLEEDNARLLREELMENLVPVVEKRRPRRVLRRVQSMCW
ncbi:ABSCISIC ACID-INSENSITIVE 5-like protein 2 isoform X2 [Cornus florida]|uniref:ABSCISIC ACID-INSENSITIVE 5-like protein 2 isoform X2 n=1 Tax=Cornus florida TaxID=4283 RepID=UPI0028A0972A|nr:ABSCISIC ACID-INSENSITIVE 5-like protein 2 isoform X2 [Cornus florida]